MDKGVKLKFLFLIKLVSKEKKRENFREYSKSSNENIENIPSKILITISKN